MACIWVSIQHAGMIAPKRNATNIMFVNLSGFVKQVGRKQKNYMAVQVKYRTLYMSGIISHRVIIFYHLLNQKHGLMLRDGFDLGKGMLDCPTCSSVSAANMQGILLWPPLKQATLNASGREKNFLNIRVITPYYRLCDAWLSTPFLFSCLSGKATIGLVESVDWSCLFNTKISTVSTADGLNLRFHPPNVQGFGTAT